MTKILRCIICDDNVVPLHKFPANHELRRKWILAVKQKEISIDSSHKELICKRICSKHFKPSDYEQHLAPGLFVNYGRGNVLKRNTVPTLLMPDGPELPEVSEQSRDGTSRSETEKVLGVVVRTSMGMEFYSADKLTKMDTSVNSLKSDTELMEGKTETSLIGDHTYNTTTAEDATYNCKVCGKSFSSRLYLTKHILRSHNKEKLYECGTCGESCSGNSSLQRHMRSHTRHKLNECGICGKTFYGTKSLQKHIQIHYCTDRPFKVSTWGKSFVDETKLQRLVPINTSEKLYECQICGKTFSMPYILQNHLKSHKPNREQLYECGVCDKTYYYAGNVQRHMRRSHTTGQKLFECGICGKAFNGTRNLQKHIQIHYCTKRPFKLSTPGKSFVDETELQRFVQSNTREKLYKCQICGKTFSLAYTLQEHLNKYHCIDRPFLLSTSHKSSVDKGKIQTHVQKSQRSDKEKRYECGLCHKTYYYAGNVQNHMRRSHNKDKLYECGVCGKAYTCADRVQKHIKCHYNYDTDKPFQCSTSNQKRIIHEASVAVATFRPVETARQPVETVPARRKFMILSYKDI